MAESRAPSWVLVLEGSLVRSEMAVRAAPRSRAGARPHWATAEPGEWSA
ncbi:MAG: hypothetical protein IRY83_05470 [Chloroflexi bacterium]|nr:hypothetical protein [Chloroflexota bacterium]